MATLVAYFLLVVLFYCFAFRFKDIIQSYARKFYGTMKESLDNNHEMTIFRNKTAGTSIYQEFREPLVEYEN